MCKASRLLIAIVVLAAYPVGTCWADFVIESPTLGQAASIDATGDCVINGDLHENQMSLSDTSSSPDFLVKTSAGVIVAKIDGCTGDLFLTGEVSEEDSTGLSSLTGSNFTIKNSGGTIVAAIDSSGNLILAGNIVVNDNICEGECPCE